MKTRLTVILNNYSNAQKFNKVVNTFNDDIDVIKGRYIIDGKSLMGLFTLDLSKPVDVVLWSDDKEEITRFNEAMKEFE